MNKFIYLLLLSPLFCGATFYVASTGGNFTTISQINSTSIPENSTVLFNRGESWNEKLTIPNNNTSWGAYGTGENPIIQNGIEIPNNSSSITISDIDSFRSGGNYPLLINRGSHHITIQNGTYDGNNNDTNAEVIIGGHATNPLHNLIIRNLEVKNSGTQNVTGSGGGIKVCAFDSIIENNTVHDFNEVGIQIAGLTTNPFFCYNVSISNNTVYNTGDFSDYSESGINLGWNTEWCVAERNYVSNVRRPILIDSNSNNNTVRNNIVKNGKQSLIWLLCNAFGDNKDNKVFHNTLIVDNSETYNGLIQLAETALGQAAGKVNSGNIIENNIVYSSNPSPFLWVENVIGSSEYTSDYNLFYNTANNYNFTFNGTTYTSLADYQLATSQDSHSIASDPILTPSYRLKPGSPAINAGVSVGVTDDYAGHPRIGTPDMGAYEYGTFIHNATLRNCTIGQ